MKLCINVFYIPAGDYSYETCKIKSVGGASGETFYLLEDDPYKHKRWEVLERFTSTEELIEFFEDYPDIQEELTKRCIKNS